MQQEEERGNGNSEQEKKEVKDREEEQKNSKERIIPTKEKAKGNGKRGTKKSHPGRKVIRRGECE